MANDCDFGTGLVKSYSRLQASNDLDAYDSRSENTVVHVGVQDERGEHLRVFVIGAQGLGKNANNGDGAAIHVNLLADDVRVGVESRSPTTIGEHHDSVLSGGLLLFEEVAAEEGLNSQRGKPVGGHDKTRQRLPGGFVGAVKIVGPTDA